MSEPLISVLVLTYHPQKDALFSTLRSVALQKDCDFEVIVCDDGSGEFFREEIEDFLKSHRADYQILGHEENQGTVKNILDGAKAARGAYIKPISPGDYLYDAHTLRNIANFMEKQDAAAAFGSMVFYSCEPDFAVKNLTHPLFPEFYDRKECPCKALKRQAVYGDLICGASAVYERTALIRGLEAISPAVRLAEDTVFQFFSAEGTRICRIPQTIVWYEHGTGVSTQKTTQTFNRIDWDFYRFYFAMAEKFPKKASIRRACRIWQHRKDGNRIGQLMDKLRPDKFFFSLRGKLRRKTLTPPTYNDEFFRQCHRAAD